MTVDQDDVLNCFVSDETPHVSGDFFEFKDQQRIEEKEVLWDLQPGIYQKVHGFKLLTLNPSRSHIGLVGLDSQLYFIDENGQACYKIRAPFKPGVIGMNAGMESGYIYGDNQIMLMDFTHLSTSYIMPKNTLCAAPIVNYNSKQITFPSNDAELIRYTFAGEQISSA